MSQATCRYGWWAVNLQVCGIKPSCLNEKQYPDIYAQKLAKTTMPLWPRFEPWPHGYKTECYPFSIFTWVNLEHTHTHTHIYTWCPTSQGHYFGRVFLMLKYTDITQNTYIQSWTVTEIMARETCGLLGCPRTVRRPWRHIHPLRTPGKETS